MPPVPEPNCVRGLPVYPLKTGFFRVDMLELNKLTATDIIRAINDLENRLMAGCQAKYEAFDTPEELEMWRQTWRRGVVNLLNAAHYYVTTDKRMKNGRK